MATKTENHPLTIDKFSAMLKTTPNEVLSLEFLVSQSLRFDYKVHHAHLAAYGLSLDLQVRSLSVVTMFIARTDEFDLCTDFSFGISRRGGDLREG